VVTFDVPEEYPNHLMMQRPYLKTLIDVTLRHDFIGAGRSGLTQGGLFTGVHVYIGTYPRRVLALALLPLQQAKPTITLQLLVTRHTRRSFAIAAASSSTATGAPSGWHVLRLWRCVAPHHSSSPRPCPSPPAALTPRRR